MYTTRLQQRHPSYRKPFFIILGIIIGVIVLLYFISAGEVKIIIKPKYEAQAVDFNAEIVSSQETSDNKISGRVLSTVVRGTEKITEVDKKEADKPATGKVTIHNELDHDQPLLSTTRLLSDSGVLFRTKDRVNAKAHSTVEVEVYADEPGPPGEIGPSHFTLPGLWQDWQNQIYGESSEPMVGGYGETDYIAQETIDRGIVTATDKLKEEGAAKAKV